MSQPSCNQRLQDLKHLLGSIFAAEYLEQRDYQFAVERFPMYSGGLYLEAILNSGRYDYVLSQGLNKRSSETLLTAEDTLAKYPHRTNKQGKKKLTLRQHGPSPGSAECPFDKLDLQDTHSILIRYVILQGKKYALIINTKPWGAHHCMLVTLEEAGQTIIEQDLLAGLQLLKALGPDYEGIFTGVLAGASIYHFHLQIHKGAAALWRNLDERRVWLKPIASSEPTAAFTLEGWPAHAFVFQGTDLAQLASMVNMMFEAMIEDDNDIPYNLSFRCWDKLTQLILFPRFINRDNLTAGEKPAHLNGDSESWG